MAYLNWPVFFNNLAGGALNILNEWPEWGVQARHLLAPILHEKSAHPSRLHTCTHAYLGVLCVKRSAVYR